MLGNTDINQLDPQGHKRKDWLRLKRSRFSADDKAKYQPWFASKKDEDNLAAADIAGVSNL